MTEIDSKIKTSTSLKPNKKRFLYLKNNNNDANDSTSRPDGLLNKLSERVSLSKGKVSELVKEVSMAVRKRKLVRPVGALPNLPDIGQLDIPSTISDRAPTGKRKSSILGEDTPAMARRRRLLEQEGHRQLAKVHAREHREEDLSAPEGDLQNSIKQHPWLDAQRFDGIDPNLNPEPPLNTEARREFDNKRREQEKEKQLRLGNMPKFSTAPKPTPK